MATQTPAPSTPLRDLAAQLLAEREVTPRAQAIAQAAAARLPDSVINVYLYNEKQSPPWSLRAGVGEASVSGAATEHGVLAQLAEQRQPLLFSGSELAREDYAHLDVRRTVTSLGYVPILLEEALLGAVEVVEFERPLDPADLDVIGDLNDFSALALASALAYENERNSNLESITRLTQFYDVEKVFHSTLQMDDLLPIITSKVGELLEVQAVNLYMVVGEDLLLMSAYGVDNTRGESANADEIVNQVGDSGEPVIINDACDERLVKRNGAVVEGAITSLTAVPLMEGGALVGVLECMNKFDGSGFDEDDVFLVTTMAETAAGALHNASLFEAERKAEILETLVKVSTEITSTLDLDRVLQAVVSEPAAVIPYERAVIALEQRGTLQVRAVTGMALVDPNNADVVRLQELLQWASLSPGAIFVSQHDETVESEREETRAKFERYFRETGMRCFYAVPLLDDDGRVGILSFESSDPDSFTSAHLEMVKILASQATVALRNASLYREVPFIDVLQPVLQRKRQFLALEKHRRRMYIVLAAAAALFLALFPLPLRVDGDAVVAPVRSAQVQPEIEGVVQRVMVREGDPVRKGTILATLEDWPYRSALAAAEAKYQIAISEMNRALAANDGTEAGIQRVQSDYWGAEVARARERLEKTRLRAPVDGVVATPHIENLAGKHLEPGDGFAEIVDSSRTTVDVALDEKDVPLVETGKNASVKLEGFPTRTFHGEVSVLSPKGQAQADQRLFFARVSVPNPDGVIRPGMQGRAKIMTRWRAAGVVLFRRPAIWLWGKLWSWFGW